MGEVIQRLFDLSFKKFVMAKIPGVVFVVGVVAALLLCFTLLTCKVLGFVTATVCFVALILILRLIIEVSLAIFQIARYAAEIARRGRDTSQQASDQHMEDDEH